jgi:hypothetical protein
MRHCGEFASLLCADPTAETAAESGLSLPPFVEFVDDDHNVRERVAIQE